MTGIMIKKKAAKKVLQSKKKKVVAKKRPLSLKKKIARKLVRPQKHLQEQEVPAHNNDIDLDRIQWQRDKRAYWKNLFSKMLDDFAAKRKEKKPRVANLM